VVDSVVLSASYSGNITSLTIQEGESIQKGALLLNIDPLQDCTASKQSPLQLKLTLDKQLKQERLQALKQQLNHSQANQTLYRALALGQQKNDLTKELQSKINLLGQEIKTQTRLLQTLKQTRQKPSDTIPGCQNQAIVAPFNAVVRRVLKNNHEFIHQGEALIILENQQATVWIEGYLNEYDLKSVYVGQPLTIEFPDNNEGYGVIKRINATASAFAERKWHYYEPVDTQVRLFIIPADSQQSRLWKRYNLLRVQIKGQERRWSGRLF